MPDYWLFLAYYIKTDQHDVQYGVDVRSVRWPLATVHVHYPPTAVQHQVSTKLTTTQGSSQQHGSTGSKIGQQSAATLFMNIQTIIYGVIYTK